MALFPIGVGLLNQNSLSGSNDQVTQHQFANSVDGSGNGNTVFQNGSDNGSVNGDNNVLSQHQQDQASITGSGNSAYQQGQHDSVMLDGGQVQGGLFGLLHLKGNDNHSTQNGDNDTTTLHGNHDNSTVNGSHDNVTATGDGVTVGVNGDGDTVELKSQHGENVQVYGSNETVHQDDNGNIVALDKDGNPVPVTQGPDGRYIVGQPPESQAGGIGAAYPVGGSQPFPPQQLQGVVSGYV
jgi:hypothetical protein